jgi:hypothetical protein
LAGFASSSSSEKEILRAALRFIARVLGKKKETKRGGRERVAQRKRERKKIKAIFIAHITSSGMRTFGGIIIYVANVLFTPLLLRENLSLHPVRFSPIHPVEHALNNDF